MKSWSNVPPKLPACVGFLYKVVHKNRLWMFNCAREIEFTFLPLGLFPWNFENRFWRLRFVKKLNSTKKGAFFGHFASPRWPPLGMRTKRVSFFIFFQELSNKKIRNLWLKMTNIALKGVLHSFVKWDLQKVIFTYRMLYFAFSSDEIIGKRNKAFVANVRTSLQIPGEWRQCEFLRPTADTKLFPSRFHDQGWSSGNVENSIFEEVAG